MQSDILTCSQYYSEVHTSKHAAIYLLSTVNRFQRFCNLATIKTAFECTICTAKPAVRPVICGTGGHLVGCQDCADRSISVAQTAAVNAGREFVKRCPVCNSSWDGQGYVVLRGFDDLLNK